MVKAILIFCFFFFVPFVAGQERLDEFLTKAQLEFQAGRVIDGRETLLAATRKFPEDHRSQLFLGRYYLYDVRNFRLAFKYISNAKRNLVKTHGDDYSEYPAFVFDEYRLILLLEIDCRSDLDDYAGALKLISDFEDSFYDESLAATKAWLLMKTGNLEESYKEAQRGVFLSGGSDTRSLNVLGIVQSIKRDREKSIRTFNEILFMLNAQGLVSQTSTPLNNVGEVYREIFQVEKAEESWSKVLTLADACEHVLPSLNLAHLYIDQLKLFRAEQVISSYESCFAADGLRDDTEHRTLLRLVKGKLEQRKGNFDKAEKLFTDAKDQHQWFGKIGTTKDDMKLAIFAALSNLYWAKANWASVVDTFGVINSAGDRVRSWWYARQAMKVALFDLFDFEDLFIRNTDAMLEYPTMGRWLRVFSRSALSSRARSLIESDDRVQAHRYYLLYISEQLSVEDLRELMSKWPEDDGLGKAEAMALLIRRTGSAEESIKLRQNLYQYSPAHFKEHGLKLPVVKKGRGADFSAFEATEESRYSLVVEEETFKLLDGDRVLIVKGGVSAAEFEEQVFTHQSDYVWKK